MKVALFGQTGQVGEALLEGCPKVQWIYVGRNRAGGDLCEPEEVYQWLLDTRPDAIVNAAAFTAVDRVPENYDEAMAVNARAPAVMARAAKALGAYFIHLSTDYVFDGSGVKPWEPGDKVCPINAYGKTKAEAEKRIAYHRRELPCRAGKSAAEFPAGAADDLVRACILPYRSMHDSMWIRPF